MEGNESPVLVRLLMFGEMGLCKCYVVQIYTFCLTEAKGDSLGVDTKGHLGKLVLAPFLRAAGRESNFYLFYLFIFGGGGCC